MALMLRILYRTEPVQLMVYGGGAGCLRVHLRMIFVGGMYRTDVSAAPDPHVPLRRIDNCRRSSVSVAARAPLSYCRFLSSPDGETDWR